MAADESVVIIGAGPYGLAAAAHLRSRGILARVFGEPMSFWEDHMPDGMLLRSAWGASHISDPGGRYSLDAYEAHLGTALSRPLPGDDFVRYGRWVGEQVAPHLDRRRVASVDRQGDAFAVALQDGEQLMSRRVLVATGLRRFAHRPATFDPLPGELVTHSMDVADPSRYAGRTVAVIGAGQSAVETAALLHEAGATVELIGRAPAVRWLTRSARLHRAGPLIELLYAPTDVGPPVVSWIVSLPKLFRRLPLETQKRMAYRSIRPAAAGWLVDRMADVKMTMGRSVVAAEAADGGALLRLDDGSSRLLDDVVLATGYQVDVAQEPLISDSIRAQLGVVGGYPTLGQGYESKVAGLHFLGAYSAPSWGPVMRFVAGTPFTGHAVAAHIASNRPARDPGSRARATTAMPTE